MKKFIRKTYKSLILIGIISFFGLNMFIPMFKVDADDIYFTISITAAEGHSVNVENNELFIDDHGVNLVQAGTDTDVGEYSCEGETCYAKSKFNGEVEFRYGGDVRDEEIFSLVAGGQPTNGPFSTNTNVRVEDYREEEGGGPASHASFSGNAWFLWNCNGNICKYKATDLTPRTENNVQAEDEPYVVNYIKESDVRDTDRNVTLEIDDIGEGDYFWTWENDDFIDRIERIEMSEEQIDEIKDRLTETYSTGTWESLQDYVRYLDNIDYEAKRAFAIDPTGARDAENSLCTNGDREFRATIYDDSEYMGVVFGVRKDDYTYFLPTWDPVFINNEFDISETTKEDPAEYDVYLLEGNLKFKFSNKNSENIVSVKPLDINSNAISVTEDNGTYTVNFNSNFYDKVKFELTDANGEKYYIQLNRVVMNTHSHFENDGPYIYLEFLYPETTNASDYEIIENVVYKDGSTESIDLTTPNRVENYLMGKGLGQSNYAIKINPNMKNVYFNAIRKGALDGNSFGGAFAGSGKGIEFDSNILSRIINDWQGRGE